MNIRDLFRRPGPEPEEESFGGFGVEIGNTVVSRRESLGKRFCEGCGEVAEMFKLTHEPSNPELYDGPPFSFECERGHEQSYHSMGYLTHADGTPYMAVERYFAS